MILKKKKAKVTSISPPKKGMFGHSSGLDNVLFGSVFSNDHTGLVLSYVREWSCLKLAFCEMVCIQQENSKI